MLHRRMSPFVLAILSLVIAVLLPVPGTDPAARVAGLSAPGNGATKTTGLTAVAIDSLREQIRRGMKAGHVPSLAVAVTRNGRIVWEEAFGFADVEHQVPATPHTPYSIASISKPLTATALMTLVERGQVDLDRSANAYLGSPGITARAGDADSATVRRLLSHTAGLPLHARFYFEGDSAQLEMDEVISRYAITVYPPGRLYNYSNLGYGLVQRIIEKASGRAFEDYMREKVFGPLGMSSSTIGTGAGLTNAAVRYSSAGKPVPFYDTDHRGASGVYASVHDLARFAMFHLGDRVRGQTRILTARSLEAMHRVATPEDSTQGYGLGWDIQRDQGRTNWMHNGSMPGVTGGIRLDPENDIAIVVLSNSENELVGEIMAAIGKAMAPRPAPVAVADSTATQPAQGFSAPASLVGEWVGFVECHDGTKIPFVVRVKPDDVHLTLGGPGTFTTVLNAARFITSASVLFGAFTGSIPTADAMRSPHYLLTALSFDGDRLLGYVAAVATNRARPGVLGSYAELKRRTNAVSR